MTTFDFPLGVTNGTLSFSKGDIAAQQMVHALTETHPGELPLSRTYGLFVDYNVPPELVDNYLAQIKETIQHWYPSIFVNSIELRLGDEGKEAEIIVDLELVED